MLLEGKNRKKTEKVNPASYQPVDVEEICQAEKEMYKIMLFPTGHDSTNFEG